MAPNEQLAVVNQRNRRRHQKPCLLYTCISKSKEFVDPVYLKSAEWKRIKNSLHKNETELQELAIVTAEKEALRQKSKELKEEWPDNPEYVKKMRFQGLQRKAEKEEAAKVKLDEEEAEFQKQKNTKLIERSRQLLLAKTEKMQLLNKAFLLSSIEKERDIQVQMNKLHCDIQKKLEADYDREILNNSLKVKKMLEEEEIERKRRCKELSSFIQTQIKEKQQRLKKVKNMELREYEVTNKLAQDHLKKEQEMKQLARTRNINEKTGLLQQIKENKILEDYMKCIEKINDEKTQIYIQARKQIKCELQKNFEKRQRFLLEKQLKAKHQLEELLKKEQGKQEEMYKKAVEEKNAAYEKEIHANQKKKEKQKEQQNTAYVKALEEKQVSLKKIIDESLSTQLRDHNDYEKYVEQETRKKLDKIKIQKEVEETLKLQMEENCLKKNYEKSSEGLETEFKGKFYKNYDSEIEVHASTLLQEAKEKDWPMYPIKVAKFICDWSESDPFYVQKGQGLPKAYPTINDYKSKTAERLGFVWP